MHVRWANKLDSDIHDVHISGIDLFDQNVGMACTKVRHRCSWVSPVLIYLIKMWVWHVLKLDTDVHGYHWY